MKDEQTRITDAEEELATGESANPALNAIAQRLRRQKPV
jgi:hypothetical protein